MYFVYIMANRKNGTIYLGQTSDLMGRVWEHKNSVHGGFTAQYGCDRLVWFEWHDTREDAFRRERQMKKWYRRWKIDAIERLNPHWDDLSLKMTDGLMWDLRRRAEPLIRVGALDDGSPLSWG